MNCSIIRDLLPLYIDDCCSEESRDMIKEHLESCAECNSVYLEMSCEHEIETTVSAPKKLKRVNDWRASIMQSILFFISFGLITIGVALEAGTGYNDLINGYFAFNIVIPATGFMLSLANWHFVKLYRDRRTFSKISLLLTVFITVAAHIWCLHHYEVSLFFPFNGVSFSLAEIFDAIRVLIFVFGLEIFLTVISSITSKICSSKYAELLGKE